LVRHIHLNPIRAKIVSDLTELSRYPYCGHSVLMGKKKRDWQDVKYVLAAPIPCRSGRTQHVPILIGICFLRRLPGLVVDLPRFV
ncbi:MAG: hypothetical protein QMD03_09295, partial [Syntrophales bacterium]|nr:hypothetical protein [Syntrophales bacterium]